MTPCPSTQPRGHGADGLGRSLVPSLPSTLSDQRYADLIALYTTLAARQLSERDPNAWVWGRQSFLPSSSIPPHLRIGDHFRIAYVPQMLPSFLEMPNSVEGQTVRMIVSASETDDTISLADVLPGRTHGVSFVRQSCLRLLPSYLRVSVRKDGMAGNTYMRSGYVLSRLFLAIR